jgi:hypothetical protein
LNTPATLKPLKESSPLGAGGQFKLCILLI